MRFYYTRASERTTLRPDGFWYEPGIIEITSYELAGFLACRVAAASSPSPRSVIITPSLSRGALLPYFIPSILPSAVRVVVVRLFYPFACSSEQGHHARAAAAVIYIESEKKSWRRRRKGEIDSGVPSFHGAGGSDAPCLLYTYM